MASANNAKKGANVRMKRKERKNKKKGLKREFPAEKDHENNARADA